MLSDITVEPGARFELQDAMIDVEPSGSLTAVGTSDDVITFTGTNAVAGSRDALIFQSNSPDNVLDFVEVSYGGGNPSRQGNVYVYVNASLTTTNSTITDSARWEAFVFVGGVLDESGNTFARNASGAVGP